MKSRLKWFAINLIAFLVMIYINFISVSLPLNGNTPQELSALYPNLFVPAGFTFSIWGIIYSFIMVFLVGQLIAAIRGNNLFDNIGFFFATTCVLNASWLVAWHYEYIVLSVIIILSLLSTLLFYYWNNDFGTARYSFIEKIQIHAPFSLYLGWISVATIANITAFLVSLGWHGAPVGAIPITAIMIIIAASLGVAMQFKRSDTLYGLVIIWALYGIYSKRLMLNVANESVLLYIVMGCMALVGVSIVINIIRTKKVLA